MWILKEMEESEAIFNFVSSELIYEAVEGTSGAVGKRVLTIVGIKRGEYVMEIVETRPWTFPGWETFDPNADYVASYVTFILRVA